MVKSSLVQVDATVAWKINEKGPCEDEPQLSLKPLLKNLYPGPKTKPLGKIFSSSQAQFPKPLLLFGFGLFGA